MEAGLVDVRVAFEIRALRGSLAAFFAATILMGFASCRSWTQEQAPSSITALRATQKKVFELGNEGKLDDALAEALNAISQESNEITWAEPSFPDLLELRVQAGYLLARLRRSQESEEQFREVERQAKTINNSDLLAASQSGLSYLTFIDRRLTESVQYAREALYLERSRHPQDEDGLTTAVVTASLALEAVGGPEDALSLLIEADRRLSGRSDDFSRLERIQVLSGLTNAYQALGDDQRLQIALARLKAASSTPGDQFLYARAETTREFNLAMDAGDFKQALALAMKNIAATQKFAQGPSTEADRLQLLAAQYTWLNDFDEAHQAYQLLFALYHNVLTQTIQLRTEAERNQLVAQMEIPLGKFYSFCYMHRTDHPEILREGYELALWQKTIVAAGLNEQLAQMSAVATPELRASIATLHSRQVDLSARLQMSVPDPQIPLLEADVERMQRSIYPQLSTLGGIQSSTYTQVAAALPAQDAAVEIVVFPFDDEFGSTFMRAYCAFVLKPGRSHELTMVKLGIAPEIEWDQTALRPMATSSADRSARRVATIVGYSSVPWWALEGVVSGARHVYLSPDGVIGRSPFFAWQGKLDKRYIVDRDDLDIRPVFTTGELAAGSKLPTAKTAVLLGYADFNDGISVPAPDATTIVQPAMDRGGDFLPVNVLENSKAEIESIYQTMLADDWKVGQPLEAAAATKTAVLSVEHPRVLHIATHGFYFSSFNAGSEMDPMGLELSLESSGLLLAGANRTLLQEPVPFGSDSGILSAADVTGLDLHGTELVVLSACETGLGQQSTSGELLGLRRSFHVAGAQSVMVSLWPVDDKVTGNMMVEFYKLWLSSGSKLDKYDALRQAARNVKNLNDSPRAWAPFVLFGNGS